ncbi:hypothetical protein HMPREF9056_01997 [Actinomyces sp. oral taxon 170 str. F0386]|nr:hypothetical protein HMPREF9056_01997 [Actinomyces sp. oral taxon 170 str. F0386]
MILLLQRRRRAVVRYHPGPSIRAPTAPKAHARRCQGLKGNSSTT